MVLNRMLIFFTGSITTISCSDEEFTGVTAEDPDTQLISAVDISSFPEISGSNPVFFDLEGNEKDILDIFSENGINTIRLRLWVNPPEGHSGFEEVKNFSEVLKQNGFNIWLSLHYSDIWADPGQQLTPSNWQGIGMDQLKDSVFTYTKKVVTEIELDFIQIGNEINTGLLHPYGKIENPSTGFLELLRSGISAVRENSPDTRIILHIAGFADAVWFFDQVNGLDYDIMGLSYYPIWHGKSFEELGNAVENISALYDRDVLIAETSYPFTLEWKDFTNNIVGLNDHLILPEFPASEGGQRRFLEKISSMIRESDRGIGFCYWGAELIAWKGTQSSDASPWENQALFDFNNQALPALKAFQME